MEIKRVSVIGLGALGILFGGQMAKNMPRQDLTFIAGRQRIDRYEREGLFRNSERCSFQYVAPEEITQPADLLLFTVKFGALPQAIEDARAAVGPHTAVLSLLNGVASEEMLAKAYGAEKVLYAAAQGMDATKTGNKLVFSNLGMISFGERNGAKSERVRALGSFFEKVGIAYELPDDPQRKLWSKFMLNTGVNQVAMVCKTNYGGLQAPGKARDMMLAAMREALAVSRAEGINLKEAEIDYWMGVIGKLDPAGTPSMRQDADAKRPSEVELFAGTVRRLGRRHGIATPTNDEIYAKVAEMEREYR